MKYFILKDTLAQLKLMYMTFTGEVIVLMLMARHKERLFRVETYSAVTSVPLMPPAL